MTVELNNVNKYYGPQHAVDGLSFSVKRGEVVGLLGPNGAGKTTTMRMISGTLGFDDGEIYIDGKEIRSMGLYLQRQVGYLPEHNPLYADMYVKEFLLWIARLHSISKARQRVQEVIQVVGLQEEQHKKINQLSKGYRQRVGLAQVLLHDPPVLILDEPISGLDPNQIIEIRKLIKSISVEKTIIFSSHIMQEIEAICDRVIILDNGKKVADAPIQNLLSNQNHTTIVVKLASPGQLQFDHLPNLVNQNQTGNGVYELEFKASDEDPRLVIFDFVVKNNQKLIEMYEKHSDIQSVFSEITKNRT